MKYDLLERLGKAQGALLDVMNAQPIDLTLGEATIIGLQVRRMITNMNRIIDQAEVWQRNNLREDRPVAAAIQELYKDK